MKAIVEIKNMRLVFRARVHRATTARDVFVRSISNPMSFLFRPPEMLELINGLNLNIYQGDRVALIGVNGAGKTSLCRAIAGVYKPTKGEINVTGKVRAIFDTMVGIFPELTGRENAEILTDFLYPDLPDRDARVADALEFSELGNFLDTPFKYFSNGMQARLCLSILTMQATDLLILDEVFEGADQFFREKIAKRVLGIIERSGAVIFVSHSEDQLRRVCNRAIVLKNGAVAFDGPVEDGLSFYQHSHLSAR
jgi:ABC-2 type transport system ATP-binding protein